MREPSILSPYGEGYCRHCRFMVGLQANGLLDVHYRGRHSHDRYGAELKPCTGSDRQPAPAYRVPYWSRKSRFRYEPPVAECPVCRRSVRVMAYASSDTLLFLRHNNGQSICLGTNGPVPRNVTGR